jgi:hypothetical protein
LRIRPTARGTCLGHYSPFPFIMSQPTFTLILDVARRLCN